MKKWVLCALFISIVLLICIVGAAAEIPAFGVGLGIAAIVMANALILIIVRTVSRG